MLIVLANTGVRKQQELVARLRERARIAATNAEERAGAHESARKRSARVREAEGEAEGAEVSWSAGGGVDSRVQARRGQGGTASKTCRREGGGNARRSRRVNEDGGAEGGSCAGMRVSNQVEEEEEEDWAPLPDLSILAAKVTGGKGGGERRSSTCVGVSPPKKVACLRDGGVRQPLGDVNSRR